MQRQAEPDARNLPDHLEDTFRRHSALAILRLLAGDVLRGAGNDDLLQAMLAELGMRCSRERLRGIVGLLERSGAITAASVRNLLVVELTRRGAEIAQGLEIQEGVERPGPDCPY